MLVLYIIVLNSPLSESINYSLSLIYDGDCVKLGVVVHMRIVNSDFVLVAHSQLGLVRPWLIVNNKQCQLWRETKS